MYNYPLIKNLVNVIVKNLHETQIQVKNFKLSRTNDSQSLIKKWIFKVYQKQRIFLITNHNQIALQGHKLVNDDQKPKGIIFLNSSAAQFFTITLLLNNQEVIISSAIEKAKKESIFYEKFDYANMSKFAYRFNNNFWKSFLTIKTEIAFAELFKKYEVI
ncbi:hypothetical protein CXP39_00840 [Mesoplasma syrphidae]|uniref:Uncharacterized protein n=1 Tax=Mesoplasma syrphidae TaxID=225999 RepID=A0A2K9CCI4_9MOLU|nr:hypothetical protein [Mesoplasma syrphidae]AUF83354.1 hypothetical protein CXP39_00840 [Mesoplasma syrphidae]